MIKLKNPQKVFWQSQKTTKGDLFEYYQLIASKILPYLKNRPITIERCPNGVGKECWIQKEAPENLPTFIKTYSSKAKSTGKIIHYILVNNQNTLLWLVNQAAIEFHIWLSRYNQKNPDWFVFDLDIVKGKLNDLKNLAFIIKEKIEKDQYQPFLKSTGRTGFHIQCNNKHHLSYQKTREYVQNVAVEISKENPKLLSLEPRVKDRKAACYLDPAQNARGRHIVAPFSIRSTKAFSVSMPIDWNQLESFKYQQLSPKEYISQIKKIEKWI